MMQIERRLESELDDLPEDDHAREELLALGFLKISTLPDDVTPEGIDEITAGMLQELVEAVRKTTAAAEEHIADLSLISDGRVTQTAEQLVVALEVTAGAIDGLYPRDYAKSTIKVLKHLRKQFQAATRDELNGPLRRGTAARMSIRKHPLFEHSKAATAKQ
ncbi:hypothetical protein ACGFI4_24655 [Micromonospora carbonacea]|uniref:hypothetical protein n=1 Tax=Micromonospora carbonacea TaxID=47853 RepID=UPI00371F7C9A